MIRANDNAKIRWREGLGLNINELKKIFLDIYGGSEEGLRAFSSPGRVNLIGEHTDYNGGYVFPAALTLSSTVIARPRKDNLINLAVTDLDDRVSAPLDRLSDYRNIRWGTAAIEVVTAIALITLGNEAFGISREIDMIEVAKISQAAEHNFIGVNCGIMDQFASAMGKKDHAILLDCRDLSYKYVPLELKGFKIVISNTKKKRSLAAVKYNERRSECEKGLEILKKSLPEITCLGDVTTEQFEQYKHTIGDEIIRKRVEHVVYENERVLKSAETLNRNEFEKFGKYMIESHNSLRDLYEVTGLELDTLVEEALKIDGVIGSRMTGAGFGGCTVSIVREDAVDNFIDRVGRAYQEKTGIKAEFYISEIGDGGREIQL